MPFLNPPIHRSLSSLCSYSDTLLADKAILYLRRHPHHDLQNLSSNFTPEAASYLLLKSQFDQTLTLKFLSWAKPHKFFTFQCKCLTLHILTRFKLYKSAQSLAEDVALSTSHDDHKGSLVFQCLKDSYHSCNSSSAVFDLVGFMPGVLSYNAILDAVIRSKGSVKFAQQVFDEMTESGVSPNVYTFNILIRGFCVAGNLEMGLRFFGEMEKRGCLPNVVTHNTLIDAYCKLGRVDEAFGLLRSMALKGLEPNLISYNVVINGLCREGRMKETSQVLEEMSKKGYVPDEVTYNTLVNGYCKEGNFHQALVLHSEMVSNGLSPNVVTYTALINKEAIGVIRDMMEKGLAPDVVSYSTIISGFCRNGEVEKAFQMKLAMVEKGVLPDAVTFSTLIHGLCLQRRLIEACDLYQEMLNVGLRPDEFTYTTLINAYCVEGDLNKALQLHDEMVQKGFLPDAVTYSVLINGLNKQARTREAKRLLLKLFYEESVPNDVTYNTLIDNCSDNEFKSVVALVKGFCMKGLMDEADQVFQSMLQRKHRPDEAVYNVIIHGHCRGGNVQRAYNLYNEMLNSGFVPHTVTVIALFKALFKEGMNEELSQVIRNILKSCRLTDAELAKVLVEINHKEGNMDAVFNVLTEMAKDGLLPNSGRTAYAGG
ncbi:hypothetical protein CMV_016419 [Castanea mollissima]|uniref:Pentatricopeptide repeat-containing protein n=1 Tax=Castanea mollissima TaxID=60419 RepID=A0A8J4VF63_9ROSI|nr:hypothetical protein CMV_016419 [Castanea mollissima]